MKSLKYTSNIKFIFFALVLFLCLFFAFSITGVVSYLNFKDTLVTLDKAEKDQARVMFRNIGSNVILLYKLDKEDRISKRFYNIKKRADEGALVYEIVLMNNQGRLVAHSKIEKLARSYISTEYNKPRYHQALQLARGSIQVKGHDKSSRMPYPLVLSLYDWLLPDISQPAIRASGPLYFDINQKTGKKKKKRIRIENSLHLMLNRTSVRRAASDFQNGLLITLGFTLVCGAALASLLMLLFNSQFKTARVYQRQEPFEDKPVKPLPVQKNELEAEIVTDSYLKGAGIDTTARKKEIKEAIFVKDDA